jgi:hypothetical protein
MKQMLAKLLDLLDQESMQKKRVDAGLLKLRQAIDELKQADADARHRLAYRRRELQEQVQALRQQLAILSINEPVQATKVAEKMAATNAILGAVESMNPRDYSKNETQEERNTFECAYIASELAETLYSSIQLEMKELLNDLRRSLDKRQEEDSKFAFCSDNFTRRAANTVADILVGTVELSPQQQHLSGLKQKEIMDGYLYRLRREANKVADEMNEQRKAK